jgi:PAS domain S-box-containing protein
LDEKSSESGAGHAAIDSDLHEDSVSSESEARFDRSREGSGQTGIAGRSHPPTEPELVQTDLRSMIDVPQIQSLMDDFHDLTGYAVSILDLKGNILIATGWQDVCTNFHRVHPASNANCLESDLILSGGTPQGSFRSYRCRNNMVDVVTPIYIGGKHVGNLFTGQFLYASEEVDWARFQAQAEAFGYPWEEYRAAIEKVPRLEKGEIEKLLLFYVKLVTIIAQQSYCNLKLAKENVSRRSAEEELLRSETRFRELFENTPVAYQSLDEHGRFIDLNQELERLVGYSRDELIGRSFADLWPEESRNLFEDKFYGFKKRGEISCDLDLVRKDGRRLVVLLEGRVQRDGSGRFRCTHCMLNDITKREEMESRVRESEQKLRSLFDNANDAIILQRPGGRFLDVNRVACERLGYTKEELLRLRPREIDDPEWDDRLDASVAKVLSDGSNTYETVSLTSSGRRIPTEVSATMVRYGSETVIMSILRDISERKRAQSALALANHKMQLMTGVTRHDLQNQLMVLRGQLELARRELPEGGPREKVIKALNASAGIEEMLNFSKEYQELGVEAPAWQNVSSLLKQTSNLARGYGLGLRNEGVHLEVYADRLLIKVFQNLVENTARHGERATMVRLYAYDDGAWMRLVYEDDGIGIPRSEKDRIFAREYGKNSGLGLFFAREILAITGIEIQECGTEGIGARFMISVPRGSWRRPMMNPSMHR